MNGASDAIKNLLEASPRVLVALEPGAGEAKFLASKALKEILRAAGKNVFLWPEPPRSFSEKFSAILTDEPSPELPQKIKIKIPKSIPLDELRYEDEGDSFCVIISPKENLEPGSIRIEKAPYEMDAAFLFVEEENDFEKTGAPVKNPPREKRVFLTRGPKTFAEKVAEIKTALDPETQISAASATALLASLFSETEYLRKASGPETFALAGSLISSGADKKAVDLILKRANTLKTAQLLGRALARTTIEEGLKTSWTFLTRKDFEKTGFLPSEENIASLAPEIRAAVTEQQNLILCFETPPGVAVFFESLDARTLNYVAGHFGLETKSPSLLIPPFKNFSEAENKIRQLLKELP